MTTIQRIWTTTAEFNTGTYVDANATDVANEVRKTDDLGLTHHGIWTGTFDAGAGTGQAWSLLTIGFALLDSSYIYVQVRSTNAPTQTGDAWIQVGTYAGASPWVIYLSPIPPKRYFQVSVFLFAHHELYPQNCRLLDVTVDGSTFTAAAAPAPVLIPDWVPESGSNEQCVAHSGALTCQAS